MPANAKTQTPGQANAFDRKRRIQRQRKQQLAQEATELGVSVTELKKQKADEALASSERTRAEQVEIARDENRYTRSKWYR